MTTESHEGFVYDLDFLKNQDWVQILLRPDDGGNTVVAVTEDVRAVTILAAAMSENELVTLDVTGKDPAKITRVKWNRG